jgi:hypothetical protein|nr:MAG TPA: hypothetical protein [Caudoviricetes sp.]
MEVFKLKKAMTEKENKELAERWLNMQMNNGCGTTIVCLLLAVFIMCLMSCATNREVIKDEKEKTEVKVDSAKTEIVKQDSTDVTHTTDVKETEKVETNTKFEKSDSTVMTVDVQGNVIKKETWHKEKETVSRNREYEKQLLDSIAHFRLARDSLRQYIAKCDSLTEMINHQEVKAVEKTKIPKIFKISLIFSIICCIFVIIKIIRNIQIH